MACYQYPLNPTLLRELKSDELRSFLKWQADTQIDREAYRNENTILEVIKRFRNQGANG